MDRTGPVPPAGPLRRSWIRYQLSTIINPETGKPYTQNDIAVEAMTDKGVVSLVLAGERPTGLKGDKVRRITARILGRTTMDLFGVALEAGDGYVPLSIPAKSAQQPEEPTRGEKNRSAGKARTPQGERSEVRGRARPREKRAR